MTAEACGHRGVAPSCDGGLGSNNRAVVVSPRRGGVHPREEAQPPEVDRRAELPIWEPDGYHASGAGE
jgi:hypothetical protein